MRVHRHAALALALAGLALFSACSRREKAHPAREQTIAPKQREASPIVPAAHAAQARAIGDLSRSCERICAASSKLNCPQAKTCQPSCMAMGSTGLCEPELGAFFTCLQKQPSEHWECLEDGTAAIREGHCENEQATFAECLHEK